MFPCLDQKFWRQSFEPQYQPQYQPTGNRWFNRTLQTNDLQFPTNSYLGDPDDLYQTSMRACHIAHRRYIKWINIAYHPAISPRDFVQEWIYALRELRRLFGHFHLPDIFAFNQFLAAVSANPGTRSWVDSLHTHGQHFASVNHGASLLQFLGVRGPSS
jgi:hypothetical protein